MKGSGRCVCVEGRRGLLQRISRARGGLPGKQLIQSHGPRDETRALVDWLFATPGPRLCVGEGIDSEWVSKKRQAQLPLPKPSKKARLAQGLDTGHWHGIPKVYLSV